MAAQDRCLLCWATSCSRGCAPPRRGAAHRDGASPSVGRGLEVGDGARGGGAPPVAAAPADSLCASPIAAPAPRLPSGARPGAPWGACATLVAGAARSGTSSATPATVNLMPFLRVFRGHLGPLLAMERPADVGVGLARGGSTRNRRRGLHRPARLRVAG